MPQDLLCTSAGLFWVHLEVVQLNQNKYWNFEKLKITNLASGSVLAQGYTR